MKSLKENLQKTHSQHKLYVDQHHIEHNLEVGDMVYLRLYPYRQFTLKKSGVEKIKPRCYRPLYVCQRLREITDELELLARNTIHNVFHLSSIKRNLVITWFPYLRFHH